ncbi:hypothetical protein V490_09248 [Pseudogymnoascus sp. VKM F-3557]|nr:hypothetical protein V490_09248 [Pseudogymnoascus sp. VKM F-3557]
MPLAFIPKSLASNSRSSPVTAIYLCAYAPNAVSGPPRSGSSISGTMTNHWVMYFAASPTQSIRCDPSPTGPGNSLDLIVTSKNYDYTINAAKIMRLTPADNLTIGHVFDHITNSKYDKYTFSAGGQGCRFWIYSVVALLRSAGYITGNTEVNACTEALQVVWTLRGEPAPASQQTGMAKGTF